MIFYFFLDVPVESAYLFCFSNASLFPASRYYISADTGAKVRLTLMLGDLQ